MSNSITLPNFLIIGAMKAGTTALYHYLNQHSQIYMSPIKETHFFSLGQSQFSSTLLANGHNLVTTLEDYQALFEGVTDELAIGECSPSYLPYPQAAENICQSLPHVKLIVILRDPIERAFSHYWHQVQIGETKATGFVKAFWEDEKSHNQRGDYWESYKYQSLYGQHIKNYFDYFGRQQLKIYTYRDFARSQRAVLQDMYRFLGVDDDCEPELKQYWRSGEPRSRLLYTFLKKPNQLKAVLKVIFPKRITRPVSLFLFNRNIRKNEVLTPEIRRQLLPVFQDDILLLQELIGRELTDWLH